MADVTVVNGANATFQQTSRAFDQGWLSESVGYILMMPTTTTIDVYKTTDSGAGWTVQDAADNPATVENASTWWDGSKFHVVVLDSANSKVQYYSFDTATDQWSTVVDVATSFTVNTTTYNSWCSITKTRGGNLLIAARGGTTGTFGFWRSTDGGAGWTAKDDCYVGSNSDAIVLAPGGAADDQDAIGIWWDQSTKKIYRMLYDDSADSWDAGTEIDTILYNFQHFGSQFWFSIAVRESDNAVLLVYANDNWPFVVTTDIKVVEIKEGSITAKTDLASNLDDCGVPNGFLINQQNGDLYIAYAGSDASDEDYLVNTKVYFKKSTNGGTSWGAEQAYSVEGDDIRALAIARSVDDAGGRVMPVWYNDDTDNFRVNDGNDIEIAGTGAVEVGLAGTQPAATGTISTPESIGLAGNQPFATATLALSANIGLPGASQPAPVGNLYAIEAGLALNDAHYMEGFEDNDPSMFVTSDGDIITTEKHGGGRCMKLAQNDVWKSPTFSGFTNADFWVGFHVMHKGAALTKWTLQLLAGASIKALVDYDGTDLDLERPVVTERDTGAVTMADDAWHYVKVTWAMTGTVLVHVNGIEILNWTDDQAAFSIDQISVKHAAGSGGYVYIDDFFVGDDLTVTMPAIYVVNMYPTGDHAEAFWTGVPDASNRYRNWNGKGIPATGSYNENMGGSLLINKSTFTPANAGITRDPVRSLKLLAHNQGDTNGNDGSSRFVKGAGSGIDGAYGTAISDDDDWHWDWHISGATGGEAEASWLQSEVAALVSGIDRTNTNDNIRCSNYRVAVAVPYPILALAVATAVAGAQPSASGDVGLSRVVAGNQPASTGAIVLMRAFIGLAGAQPAPSGTIATGYSLAGAQPAPTGSLTVEYQIAATGTQPAAAGAVATEYQIALEGAQPAPSSSLSLSADINLAGTQPAASGEINLEYRIALSGNQPAATGAISAVEPGVTVTGAQPASSGALAVEYRVALAGAHPVATGAVTQEYQIGLVGSQSAPSGSLRLSAQISVAGTQPAPSGVVALEYQIVLIGTQPAATGEANVEYRISLAGAQPASSASLATSAPTAVAGSQPTATGALTQRYLIALAGTQPAATGGLSLSADIALAGAQPAATGAIAIEYQIALIGAQPASTGGPTGEYQIGTAGAQPAASGAISLMRAYIAISGAQSAASGTIATESTIPVAGAQPAAVGAISLMRAYIAVAGTQPAPTGVIATGTDVALAGIQPAATGAIALMRAYIGLAGTQPAPSGMLSTGAGVQIVGNQPASVGAISLMRAYIGLVGVQPSASGGPILEYQIGTTGTQPAAASVLTVEYQIALSGAQMAASGAVTIEYAVALGGGQPAAVGTLALLAHITLSGTQPAGSGTVSVDVTAIGVVGNQPSATGALSVILGVSLSGAQPASSGALSLLAHIALTGNQPPASSVLSIGYQIVLAGSQDAPSGSVAVGVTAIAISGTQLASSGALTIEYQILIVGIQPAGSGGPQVIAFAIALAGAQAAPFGTLALIYEILVEGNQPSATGAGAPPPGQPAGGGEIGVRYLIVLIGAQPAAVGAIADAVGGVQIGLLGNQGAPAGMLYIRFDDKCATLWDLDPARRLPPSGHVPDGEGELWDIPG